MNSYPDSYTVKPLAFHGEGRAYFGIWFVNALLTAFTLGLYYPWARASRLRYLYSSLELDGSRFAFHGTGAEIFKGFVKVWLVLLAVGGTYLYALIARDFVLLLGVVGLFLAAVFGLLGVLIHGAVRYRASRTSWRGIRFGYDGSAGELTKLCLKGVFLTMITFGIYSFWFISDMRRYVFGHLRYGTARFSYHGVGSDLFGMAIKAMLLAIPTLYLYLIEYQRERLTYLFRHLQVRDGDPTLPQLGNLTFQTAHRFWPLLGLMITNVLLIVFTLGLGFPWVVIRTLRYVYNNLAVAGDLDLAYIGRGAYTNAEATAEAALDASGLEDALDVGDFGLI